jgi:hypothetical protein
MTVAPQPLAAPVDRDAVFARWEQRLALITPCGAACLP